MSLTDRSRLYCTKRRQQKQNNQNRTLHSASGLEPELAKDSGAPNVTLAEDGALAAKASLTAQEKAWKKYLHAKAIYEETKATEHWQYMQECISDYEKTLRPNSTFKNL